MKFKGDIVVTDPRCFVKGKDNDKQNETITEPDAQDYFLYGDFAQNYPDAVEVSDKDTPNCIMEIRRELGLDLPYKLYRSKLYDECQKKYISALRKYQEINMNDWEKCEYGTNMEALGIKHYLYCDTDCTEWAYTSLDSDEKEISTKFYTEGTVGVFLLDEVLAYNPDFNCHTKEPRTAIFIKNFDGDVKLKTDRTGLLRITGIGKVNFEVHPARL